MISTAPLLDTAFSDLILHGRGKVRDIYQVGDQLLLADNVAVALDAAATEAGKIDATEFDLTPETNEQGAKLTHAFPKGTMRVVLRTQRGEIVIRKRK